MVDVSTDPALVERDDLLSKSSMSAFTLTANSSPGHRQLDEIGQGDGEDETKLVGKATPKQEGKKKNSTHSVHLPLAHVVVHDARNQVGIPPDFGVVLELGVVEGDAPLPVNSKGMTRSRELRSPQIPNAVIVPWMSSAATPSRHGACR